MRVRPPLGVFSQCCRAFAAAALSLLLVSLAEAAPTITKLSLRGLQAGGTTRLAIDGNELGPQTRVLLVGLRTFDLSDIALLNGALYYPDFFKGVATDGEKDPQYTLVLDPIQHLNTKGYAVVVENLLPSVELLLQAPPPLALPAPENPAAMNAPVPPRTVTR